MTQPLAIVLYEKLLPGSQLLNRLQDLGYRVQALHDPDMLTSCAESTRPIIVVADLESARTDVCAAIGRLRSNPGTRHIPVIAFVDEGGEEAESAARRAGATLTANDTTVVNQLPQLLEQALQVE